MRRLPLKWKLMLINLIGFALVVAVIDISVRQLAGGYFMDLAMSKEVLSAEITHQMFVATVTRYLWGAAAVACVVSTGLTYWLVRRSLEPLQDVLRGVKQISAGNYSVRVRESDCGEISDLARMFNRMVESLARLERLRKDMVSNAAHELRTPLTNIRGYLEALIESVIPPSPEVFESLYDETLRLMNLSESLLRLAQADAARESLQIECLQLDELLTQIIQLFDLKFSGKRLEVTAQFGSEPLQLLADGDKMAQIMSNLLENAWRYTPTGGRVAISAERHQGGVRVMVANTWVAADRGDNSQVFERFYREEPSRSRDYGGAGLGLAIVKELVEERGGTVGSDIRDGMWRVWFTWPK